MKIADSVRDYLEFIKKENKSSLTVRNYKHYLSRFVEFLNKHHPLPSFESLNNVIIYAYKKYLTEFKDAKGKLLDNKTQGYHLIALRSFIKYLRFNNIDTINPEVIEVPKSQSKPLKFLDQSQMDTLLRLTENLRDKCILELILSTGLRVSDLVALNKNNINLNTNEIRIFRKGISRSIFLTPDALYWLKKYLGEREDSDQALFVRTSGKKDADLRLTVRSIQRIVEKYVEKAGLTVKATPHTLRHTFAINLLSEGENLPVVQKILDHKNIVTTQIYTHVTNPQLKEIHRKFHGKQH